MSIDEKDFILQTTNTQAHSDSKSFADDLTAVVITDTEEQNKLVLNVLQELYVQYFSDVGLKVNLTKNEHVDQVRLLGLNFKSGWKYDPQVSSISSRTSFRLTALARVKKIMSIQQLKNITDSLVLSLIRYGIELVGTHAANLKKLQVMQNRAKRLVTGKPLEEKVSNLIDETRWLSVQNMMRVQQIQIDVVQFREKFSFRKKVLLPNIFLQPIVYS